MLLGYTQTIHASIHELLVNEGQTRVVYIANSVSTTLARWTSHKVYHVHGPSKSCHWISMSGTKAPYWAWHFSPNGMSFGLNAFISIHTWMWDFGRGTHFRERLLCLNKKCTIYNVGVYRWSEDWNWTILRDTCILLSFLHLKPNKRRYKNPINETPVSLTVNTLSFWSDWKHQYVTLLRWYTCSTHSGPKLWAKLQTCINVGGKVKMTLLHPIVLHSSEGIFYDDTGKQTRKIINIQAYGCKK